ncbi:acyltransferase family protein [Robertkochia solimangrovi]|uniref:acyltransferase family protein n=1 Tax=Robertkochia solimangrovi TaxID=2213046 RepID=UPI001180A216|nr:DUF5009 domain-containing protein [Robertkochia solimangrovi]TRZ41167.1 DUF5009 domain-containing protein [Robertkochia solimangrovi]
MTKTTTRYLSLDVFRGLDVALMIIVNSPGSWSTSYSPLLHAPWHGFRLTDIVFPTFLFVVGNSMSFSLDKYKAAGTSVFLRKVLKRSLLIFLIGFLLNWFPFFDKNGFIPPGEIRIFGVLQRIALCYGIASLIIFYLKERYAMILGAALLLIYPIILHLFGDLTLEGNAAGKLDLLFINPDQLYGGEGIPFDPEGILSTLPAIVNVLAGYFCGKFLRKSGQNYQTLAIVLIAGALLTFAGLTWDLFLPINKKLWTSSFVLYTVGIDLTFLAILIYFIDIKGWKKWTYFFEVFGKNTLFTYLLSIVMVILLLTFRIEDSSAYGWIYRHIFSNTFGPYAGSLGFALWVMLTCWTVGYLLDKKGIYIKI